METRELHFGERIRVNVPGFGDNGQLGTVKKVRGGRCDVHLDWDEQPKHTVWFYDTDLDRIPDYPTLAPAT